MRISLQLLLGFSACLLLLSSVGATAYAEAEISGKYRNSVAGYEIAFPKGWSGLKLLGVAVQVAPGGIDFLTGVPKTSMMILHLNRTAIEGWKDVSTTLDTTSDPGNCKEISSRYITINEVRALELVNECTINGEFSKSKQYLFLNKGHIISVSLSADSEKRYKDNLKVFEKSVKTIKIQKPQDIKPYIQKMTGRK